MAAFACAELLVVGLSLLVIRLVVGRDWPRPLAVRLPGVAHTLMALAAFPGVVLLGNGAYTLLKDVLHVPTLADLFNVPDVGEMVGVFQGWPVSVAVLIIGLGPGLGEELWCRGFLGRGLVGRYGVVLGVIFSSFFFGLIHLDPCQGAMAAVLGLFLHFVYLTSRSLFLPVLLHFLNNSFAVSASRFKALAEVDKNPASLPLVIYLAGIGLVLTVSWALYFSRVRFRDERTGAPWKPAFPGVAWPAEPEVRVERPYSWLALAAVAGAFLAFLAVCVACYSLTRSAP
jgi:membrane protease YdiL (CAAX protease family)